jgi:Protein of unknown function (DUF2934)
MAKKSSSSKKIEPVSKKPASKAVVSTPVRNSAIPKPAPAARKSVEITSDMIAVRAFEIHASGRGGSELDNWFAAERELRSGI